jgi:hypothetical protein
MKKRYRMTLDEVKQKVNNAFALRVGEKVVIEYNGEILLCMDILTTAGLKIANDCIKTMEAQATFEDDLRVVNAEIGTSLKSMLQ